MIVERAHQMSVKLCTQTYTHNTHTQTHRVNGCENKFMGFAAKTDIYLSNFFLLFFHQMRGKNDNNVDNTTIYLNCYLYPIG